MSRRNNKKEWPRVGVYAGSFDPITRGHLDIILQAAKALPKLYVVVGINPKKKPLFTEAERIDMIQHEIDAIILPALKKVNAKCDIVVTSNAGLTAAFMKANNAPYYVRGLRQGTDFEQEYPIIQFGKDEYNKFTPLFMVTMNERLHYVSSSMAREGAYFGGTKSLKRCVTPYVMEKLLARTAENKNPPPQPKP